MARLHPQLLSIARHLRRTCATREPIHVRAAFPRGGAALGEHTFSGAVHVIRIGATLDTTLATGVLLHEWAHALSNGLDSEDHGEWFEQARHEVWRHYRTWNLEH